MTDDATHGEGTHIPTPAEVHHDHPTVLVPVPPDEDAVRRLETHDGENRATESEASETAPTDTDGSASVAATTVQPVGDDSSAGTERSTSATTPRPIAENRDADSPVVDLEFSPDSEPESEVLAQVIADAASTVAGVHALGSPAARAVDSARVSLLGRTSVPGVNVLEDDDVLNVGVSLVAEYPANVTEVADSVRADVASALEGRHDGPVDIDVTVTDVHGPFDPVEPDPGQAIDGAKDALGDAKDRAGAAIGDATDRAGAVIGDAKTRAGDAIDEAKVRAGDAIDGAKAGAANAADAAADALEDAKATADRAIDDAKAGAADAADDASDATDDVRNDAADAVDDLADDVDAARTDDATDARVTEASSADGMTDAAERLAEAAEALATAAERVAHDEPQVHDGSEVTDAATRDTDTDARQTTDRHPGSE